MFTLRILREIHTKSVAFVIAYTRVEVKSEMFMDIPIGFRVEGDHPRSFIIRLDNNIYGMKFLGLAWFEKLK